MFFGVVLEVGFLAIPDWLDSIYVDNGFHSGDVAFCEECHCDAFSAHSCRSSGSVGVGIVALGEFVVYYMARMCEVESSTGEVGRNHYLNLHPFEPAKKRCPPGLVESAVDDFGGRHFLLQSPD